MSKLFYTLVNSLWSSTWRQSGPDLWSTPLSSILSTEWRHVRAESNTPEHTPKYCSNHSRRTPTNIPKNYWKQHTRKDTYLLYKKQHTRKYTQSFVNTAHPQIHPITSFINTLSTPAIYSNTVKSQLTHKYTPILLKRERTCTWNYTIWELSFP